MDNTIKKRLGQYFSGSKVANLLVDICAPTCFDRVIDPMAGIGDMLDASIQYGVPSANVCGIEIDPVAGMKCKEKISSGKVFIGDAFSLEPYSFFERKAWDLVITNPPYVRYQSIGNYEGGGFVLKNATETRHSLSKIVNTLEHLSDEEKACFQKIIRNYSGLSDLAVPAWILCAALTKHDGQLAMVVPESWISRDYALIIKYMLLKFFDIKFIVEDMNSVWFPDALVKTNLLVAKRVKFRSSILDIGDAKYKYIRLNSGLAGETSLIEKLSYNGQNGYKAFRSLVYSGNDVSMDGFELKHITMSDFISEMTASPVFDKLLSKLEPRSQSISATTIPKELRDVIGEDFLPCKLADIRSWGFQVGQGLRTGANKFFYAKVVKTEGDIDYLAVDSIFGNKIIPVSHRYSLPVFRYQSELSDSYVISNEMLSHRLLYIQEDFFTVYGTLQNPSDAPLYKHITEAEQMTIYSGGKATRFPELTAVKPNIRPANSSGNSRQRFWFMLPELAKRHVPQLCISRVNYKNVKCCLIAQDGIVVDANFSTLWTDSEDKRKVYALFAVMNSLLIRAYLELIATVMGGGALKIEASHIRRLLLPFPTEETISSLFMLGKRFAECNPTERGIVQSEIDRLVMRLVTGIADPQNQCGKLQAFLHSKINARQR